uniref:Mucin-1-like n=1 Tax=Mesocestoides corti TaxID=53468 RepID=A0A5K3FTL8_MESCO
MAPSPFLHILLLLLLLALCYLRASHSLPHRERGGGGGDRGLHVSSVIFPRAPTHPATTPTYTRHSPKPTTATTPITTTTTTSRTTTSPTTSTTHVSKTSKKKINAAPTPKIALDGFQMDRV